MKDFVYDELGFRLIHIRTKPSGRYHLYRQLWDMRTGHRLVKSDLSRVLEDGSIKTISTVSSSDGAGRNIENQEENTIENAACQLKLPFKTDEELRSDYISIYGGIRFGKILEDLDVLAATVAYLHCGTTRKDSKTGEQQKVTIVTAAVDRIDILEPKAFDRICDIRVRALPTNIGKSSIECTVVVECGKENCENEWNAAAIARFIMVARSADGSQPLMVPPLKTSTSLHQFHDAIQKLIAFGEKRRADRLERLSRSLSKMPPSQEESNILHGLFLAGKQSNTVPISSTVCKQTQICHPQVQKNVEESCLL